MTSIATDRYPVIIARNRKTCAVIDTTICADKFDINEAHSHKVANYNQPAIHKWRENV